MRKQIRQKYIEGNKKEDKRFFELKEHPQSPIPMKKVINNNFLFNND